VKTVLRILILISALLVAEIPVAAQSAADLTRQGVVAYQAGDLVTAIAKLREAQKLSPNDSNIRLYLGLMLYQQDPQNLEAQELLESVADRVSENSEVQIKLLDSYLATGNKAKTDRQLSRLQPLVDRDEALGFQVIYLLIRYGRSDDAREHIGKLGARIAPGTDAGPQAETGRKDSRLGELYFVRGILAASENRKEDALKNLQLADRHEFPPRDSHHMVMLADSLYRIEEFRLAWQAYEEYLKHNPSDVEARMRLGLSHYSLGVLEAAQAAFEQVRAADPLFPQVHYYLGEVFFLKNDLDGAEKSLQQELRNDPKCGPCMAKLARVFYQKGDNEQAEEYLGRARQLSPDWPETHLVSGLLANRKGRYEEAIKELEKVVEQLPDFPTGHLQLSIAYARAGQAEKSRQHRETYNRLLEAQRHSVASGIRDERKPR